MSNNQKYEPETVYIVGHIHFQNELMASFIEREITAKCEILERPEDLEPFSARHHSKHRLILYDCRGKEACDCFSSLEKFGSLTNCNDLIALFNATSGKGDEDVLTQKNIRGLFYTNDSFEMLLKGIKAILQGEIWLSRKLMSRYIVNHNQNPDTSRAKDMLTQREKEIVLMIASGLRNREISDKLCISPHTVKTHIYKIFQKLEVPNRLQAALWAAKNLKANS